MLWGRAAGRCCMTECRTQLVMDATETDDPTLIGEECHIIANSPAGPRGDEDLPSEKRDLYDNLILLCRNHHKIVDDNPLLYSSNRLREIKRIHESWVQANVDSYNASRQRDDEYYASIVERWERDCQVDNWEAWSSWMLGGGQPRMDPELDKSLFEFRRWIFGRVWPGRHLPLERAFQTFRVVLQDLQEIFREHVDDGKSDRTLVTKKFYKLDRWDEKLYHKLLKEFEDHVDLVQDLVLELSRAANWICDEIRNHLISSYRLTEGRIVIQYGPTLDFQTHWRIPRYSAEELKSEIPYPGLEAFKSERVSRDLHFGFTQPQV